MITEQDIPGFFCDLDRLNRDDYLLCDFIFETAIEPRLAAANVCCEMSTAQWKRPGINEDLRGVFGAKVVSFKIIAKSERPIHSFPWLEKGPYTLCEIRIAYPHVHFGSRLPNLLSALAGEGAFYCPGISVLRLKDIHFPNAYLQHFQGPQFGVQGLRKLLKVQDRPFFIGVVKPNLGLSPKDFAQLAYQSWLGGLDIAKDDEMLADAERSSIQTRMEACGKARHQAEQETGSPKMMIANLTDEIDAIPTLYHQAKEAGANGVMLNGYFTGFSALRVLRKSSELPLMGHFTGMALYDRIPGFGIDGAVLIKLQRLAGCDIIAMPGFGARMKNTDEVVSQNVQACLEPMGPISPALPVPGGSDWAGSLEKIYHKLGHADFGLIAGRGVYGHPNGPEEGARSLHEAWEALREGVSLHDYAKTHPALQGALGAFSS